MLAFVMLFGMMPTQIFAVGKYIYFAPGAEYGVYDMPDTYTYDSANGAFYLPSMQPARYGYRFTGWNTIRDGSGTYYAAGGYITAAQANSLPVSLTLYAQWAEVPVRVRLAANVAGVTVNGLTTAWKSVRQGSTVRFSVDIGEAYDPTSFSVLVEGVKYGASEQHGTTYWYEFTADRDTTVTINAPLKKRFPVVMPVGEYFNAYFTAPEPYGEKAKEIEYGTSYSFKVDYDASVLKAPIVTVNGVQVYPNSGGVYTVPASSVTGPQTVRVEINKKDLWQVTFTLPQFGGSEYIGRVDVVDGHSVSKPIDPQREGYEFLGWFTQDQFVLDNGTPYVFSSAVSNHLILFGKFKPITYKITFDPNPTDESGVFPKSIDVTLDKAVQIPQDKPVREGWTFLGWNTSPGAETPVYQAGEQFTLAVPGDVTLYAVWERLYYTVTVNNGDGYTVRVLEPLNGNEVEYGGSFRFTVTVARGYSEHVPDVTYNEGASVATLTDPDPVENPDGSVTYTYTIANIKENKVVNISVKSDNVYTVNFWVLGEVWQQQRVAYRELVTRPQNPDANSLAAMEGWIFLGWYTDDGTFLNEYDFATPVTKDLDLYAKLEPIVPKIYMPEDQDGWDAEPDYELNPHEVAYGSDFTFTVTVAEGFDSSGMVVATNGYALAPVDGAENPFGPSVYTFVIYNVTEDQIVTVVGVVRRTITITYNDNGGEGGPVEQVVPYYVLGRTDNGTIIDKIPVRIGYDFVCWNTMQDGSGNDYKAGDEADFKEDVVLYAIWQEKATVITLEADVTEQYEAEPILLTAHVEGTDALTGNRGDVTSGSVFFYRGVGDPDVDELLGTAVLTGGYAKLEVVASDYVWGGENIDRFWAKFIPTEGSGYAECDTLVDPEDPQFVEVKVFSAAITWELDAALSNVVDGGNNLTIKDEGGNVVTEMVAGQIYTLELPPVFPLDAPKTPVVGEDYYIEWQYHDDIDWIKYTDSYDKDSVRIEAEFSQYSFRAVVRPLASATSTVNTTHYIKATKYKNDNATLIPDEYVGQLITNPTKIVLKQYAKIEVIAESDYVYQLNDLKIEAVVEPTRDDSTKQPTGDVTFYYSVDNVTWIELGVGVLADPGTGKMTASIVTDQLPVDEVTNKRQVVYLTAIYQGDDTFDATGVYNADSTITNTDDANVKNTQVEVYSSVVHVDPTVENVLNMEVPQDPSSGIYIKIEGVLKTNETRVNLRLSDVFTLDYEDPSISLLSFTRDYTVQWQKLPNYNAYSDIANATAWTDIVGATNDTCQLDVVEQGTAYRAVITVNDAEMTRGSYNEVVQAIPGRIVYYSNIVAADLGDSVLTINITTDNNERGYEGIVEGETVTIHTFIAGATDNPPISMITAKFTDTSGNEEVIQGRTNSNGYTALEWKPSKPGIYTLELTSSATNGYGDNVITRTLIVRDDNFSFNVTKDTFVYDNKAKGLELNVVDMCDDFDAEAQKRWSVTYTDEDGNVVEPTQVGTYKAVIRLQECEFWTEYTQEATLTIEKRKVSVVDLIAQTKVYDGTTEANILEIILEDAATDPVTGLPNVDTGMINADSLYAVGTAVLDKAEAGKATLSITDVELKGDDAHNYELDDTSYTEEIDVLRSQVKGAVAPYTFKYTGKKITLPAAAVYMIDQAGNELTADKYEIVYYYHNGKGVEKVDALNKLGLYTVIALPDQNNYKGGAAQKIYVIEGDGTSPDVDKNFKSALISISNTVELYGDPDNIAIVAEATDGETVKVEYWVAGAWTETAPENAGRYAVKATAATGDTAYGLYTIVKARPNPKLSAEDAEYNSARYDGTPTLKDYNGAEVYYTYAAGVIHGIDHHAPTEVADYIVTAHVGETDNYTSHEVSAPFSITKKAVTVTAMDLQRQQYRAYPDMIAIYDGLAEGGVAKDTSLRDVQIQPEFWVDYSNENMTNVGKVDIDLGSALAVNYELTYVPGYIVMTNRDPQPELAIHGMPYSGAAAQDTVYYDDVIQLYAYGNQDLARSIVNTSGILTWSIESGNDVATINDKGILTIIGVGNFTVKLTRGSGEQAISTTISATALKKEVTVFVPNSDLVYSGTEQTYPETPIASEGTAVVVSGDKREFVGSQITLAKVPDSELYYQSELYGGRFTINDKEIDIVPTGNTTVYGTKATNLKYSEVTQVGGKAALINAIAVSVADSYDNLDIIVNYEILVAGEENINYNVRYVTKPTADGVTVTAKPITVTTGTLDDTIGITGGSRNPYGDYPANGVEVDPAAVFTKENMRMFGEPNLVMNYLIETLIAGDSEADMNEMIKWLVRYNYMIDADANIKYTDPAPGIKDYIAGREGDYVIESNIDLVNYSITVAKGFQNIYQRPVTLGLLNGGNSVDVFALDAKEDEKLKQIIIDGIIVSKYQNANGELVGGLAELLKHTIKDLQLEITLVDSGPDTKIATVKIGNLNYWGEDLVVTVNIVKEKYISTITSFERFRTTAVLTHVYDDGTTANEHLPDGDVLRLLIFKHNGKPEDQQSYADYIGETPVRNVEMVKVSGRPGEYIVSYEGLPADTYRLFAIAEGYTIVTVQ